MASLVLKPHKKEATAVHVGRLRAQHEQDARERAAHASYLRSDAYREKRRLAALPGVKPNNAPQTRDDRKRQTDDRAKISRELALLTTQLSMLRRDAAAFISDCFVPFVQPQARAEAVQQHLPVQGIVSLVCKLAGAEEPIPSIRELEPLSSVVNLDATGVEAVLHCYLGKLAGETDEWHASALPLVSKPLDQLTIQERFQRVFGAYLIKAHTTLRVAASIRRNDEADEVCRSAWNDFYIAHRLCFLLHDTAEEVVDRVRETRLAQHYLGPMSQKLHPALRMRFGYPVGFYLEVDVKDTDDVKRDEQVKHERACFVMHASLRFEATSAL